MSDLLEHTTAQWLAGELQRIWRYRLRRVSKRSRWLGSQDMDEEARI